MGVKNQRYKSIDASIRKNKTLEKAADKLNRSLSLPHDIPLRAMDCNGVVNAFYNPKDKSITMCYELMEFFYRTFKRNGSSDQKANDQMNKAITFIFLHELGHAWGCQVQGIPVRRIVLHGGGGFCEHTRSGTRTEQELIIAMGPLVNLALWALGSLVTWYIVSNSYVSLFPVADYLMLFSRSICSTSAE